MKLSGKICSSVLALAMVLNIYPTVGFAQSEIMHGQILMEDGTPAAGIKVDILSSIIDTVYDNDVTGFANTYHCSIYTNENGIYEFNKPSEYCLVEVDLESLPSKTGIDTNSIFLYPNDNLATFTIYHIDDVDFNTDDDIVVYNDNGEEIFTHVSVDYSRNESSNDYDVFNSKTITINQSINANDHITEFTTTEDLSRFTLVEKADYLYSRNLISEEEKIIGYLNAVENGEYGEMECCNPIYDALTEYYDNNNSALSTRIASTLALSDESSSQLMADYFSNPKVKSADMFTIHYEADNTQPDYMSNSVLSDVVTTLKSVSKFFFTDSDFKTTSLETGESTYHIYFVSDKITANGLTSKANGGCYIIINFETPTGTFDTKSLKRTTAHETFHAIQESYKKTSGSILSWFKEAGASWAGLRCINEYDSWGRTMANKYLSSTEKSLTDFSSTNNRSYGMFLFFQYICQKHGDVSAMKRILEAYEEKDDIYEAIEYCPESGTVSFRSLFAGFQAYNADTRYYNNYTNGTSRYNNATIQSTNSLNLAGIPLAPTSTKHYQYTNSTSASSRLAFTFSVTGDYNEMAISLAKYKSDGTANLLRVYPNKTTSYTFAVSNYTSTGISKVTVAVSNTNINNATYTFNLSANVT